MRNVASSHGDPYCATSAAASALYGPRHGGANERVLEQLKRVGSVDNIPALLQRVHAGEERLMGFGHRVYRTFDPRSRVLKHIAQQVYAETGGSPLLDVALELERIALQDDYLVRRKLYPNVDFYSGIILDAMGFPADVFTVAVCNRADRGVGRAVSGIAAGSRAKHRAPPPDLSGSRRAGLPGHRRSMSTNSAAR